MSNDILWERGAGNVVYLRTPSLLGIILYVHKPFCAQAHDF
jgi:hypothetical protein